jgi:hypothetical protein
MTIKIEVQNWKHIPSELALQFVLKEVAKDAANGTLASGKTVTANYYDMNGIEYRATVSYK